jgi:hypothetical protein
VLLLPVRVKGSGLVKISALQPDGESWSMQWDLDSEAASETARLAWVKRRIKHLEQTGCRSDAIEQASHHNLLCQGVSFVAWDETAKTAVAKMEVIQPAIEKLVRSEKHMHMLISDPNVFKDQPRFSRKIYDDCILPCNFPIHSTKREKPIEEQRARKKKWFSRLVDWVFTRKPSRDSWYDSLQCILKQKFQLSEDLCMQICLALRRWAGAETGRTRHDLLKFWAGKLAKANSTIEQLEFMMESIPDDSIQATLKHLREWRGAKHQ